MKKHILLSAVAVGLLGSVSVNAADDLSSMFSEGKTSGQIREFSINRDIDVSTGGDSTRRANAIGGHLKFETADYKGLSFGTALYTTNGFLNPSSGSSTAKDPTLFGAGEESYSILGEAYLQYKTGNTTFKGGRQKLNTPMAGADDARMLPNLFEAYLLTNTDVTNTTLIAGHVTRFAQGTFGRAYNAAANTPNAILSATSGYSAWDSKNQTGEFVNMGTYAVNESTDGVTVGAAIYKKDALKVQLWDYYAHDLMNIIYGQADFSWKCLLSDKVKPFVAAQFIKENDVGSSYAGDVDSMYYGVKAGAKVENFGAYLAYSKQSEADNASETLEKATITPWGGMPAFTQGMVTRHQFMAGTAATKLAAWYNWKAFGPNLKTVLYAANYDMADNNGYTDSDASETGFDFIYYPEMVKNLQLRLRGNYADDFFSAGEKQVGWSEYRFIANYNF